MKNKTFNFQLSTFKFKKGMSYVELIVVLGIFFAMTAVVITNSSGFKARTEIKTLANDIALKIVESQKYAMSGKFPPTVQQQFLADNGILDWKPSYGICFDLLTNNKQFIYFADLTSNKTCDSSRKEYLETFSISKGNYVKSINLYFLPATKLSVRTFSVAFTRPNGSPSFFADNSLRKNVSYVEIIVSSSAGITNTIKVYPSGRLQIN